MQRSELRATPTALAVAGFLLANAACSNGPSGTVTVDVTSVWSAALIEEAEVEQISVRVSGPDFAPIVEEVSPDVAEVEIEVPAGPNRVFVVEALVAGEEGVVPFFWGRTITEVPAGLSEVEVIVDPAGRVSVSVVDLFGGRFPEAAVVRFEPLDSNEVGVERR
ncbi:MAG: hypothetical protein AAF658_17420 [Myxococcota bacterium]